MRRRKRALRLGLRAARTTLPGRLANVAVAQHHQAASPGWIDVTPHGTAEFWWRSADWAVSFPICAASQLENRVEPDTSWRLVYS